MTDAPASAGARPLPRVAPSTGGRPQETRLKSRHEIARGPKLGGAKKKTCQFCGDAKHVTFDRCDVAKRLGAHVDSTKAFATSLQAEDEFVIETDAPGSGVVFQAVPLHTFHVVVEKLLQAPAPPNTHNTQQWIKSPQSKLVLASLYMKGGVPMVEWKSKRFFVSTIANWVTKNCTNKSKKTKRVFHNLMLLKEK